MHDRPRILICDDEPQITASIKVLLDPEKYEIHTTNSSRQALILIEAEAPDLVILDVMMPELTGFDVLDSVDRSRFDPAFIMVTGESSIDSAINAIRKGAVDYVRKPFEPEELVIRVENVLRQRRMRYEQMCVQAENRQLESQLRQSQKMEAIGTLAGGIAHDFNNVLSIILGNAELAMTVLPPEHTTYQNLEQIFEASLRAREMIRQLLNFSRKQETGRRPLNLGSVISESLKLLRASLPSDIGIVHDPASEDCTVLADATQLHQIMLNLCTNAAHAMETDGGILRVMLEKTEIDAGQAAGLELTPGTYACLTVVDTGRGIPADIIGRIFDPYFTTREVGKGTGMGLAVVHGIVKAGSGSIRAESRPGQTCFRIYLPCISEAPVVENATFDRRQLPGGTEHVLIVDDEEMLVGMMQQTLEQLGYRVTAYTDSTAALRAIQLNPYGYDLLISDMTMPGMGGAALVRAVRRVSRLPIILCTGYNEKISEDNVQSLGIQALIMKPVGMQQLAKTMRNVLMPVSTERREAERFLAPTGAFIMSRCHPDRRFDLVDVSMRGLSYAIDADQLDRDADDMLTLCTPAGDFQVSGLTCRNVYRISVERETPRGISMQVRRGVEFENLNMLQLELLTRFIHHHATELLH